MNSQLYGWESDYSSDWSDPVIGVIGGIDF